MSACWSFYAYSEIVKDIIVEGNQRISDETVIIYGEIKKNDRVIVISTANGLKFTEFLHNF